MIITKGTSMFVNGKEEVVVISSNPKESIVRKADNSYITVATPKLLPNKLEIREEKQENVEEKPQKKEAPKRKASPRNVQKKA